MISVFRSRRISFVSSVSPEMYNGTLLVLNYHGGVLYGRNLDIIPDLPLLCRHCRLLHPDRDALAEIEFVALVFDTGEDGEFLFAYDDHAGFGIGHARICKNRGEPAFLDLVGVASGFASEYLKENIAVFHGIVEGERVIFLL